MNNDSKTVRTSGTVSDREQGYRLAKLIRAGSRELARQLNLKKSQKQR